MNQNNNNENSGIEIVSKSPSILVPATSIQEIEALARSAGPKEVSSTILMYILENTSSLEEALAAFYLYGNQFAAVLEHERMWEIIKTIYMQYGKSINTMIEGVAGVEDKNAYIFNFLVEMLPSIYSSKFINVKPIDDLMKPMGLLPLLLKELHLNKHEAEDMIRKFFYIRRQIPGCRQEEVVEKENNTINNFEFSFQGRFDQVSQIFETSNNSAVQDRIEDIIKAMNGMNFLPGAGGVDKETFSEGINEVSSKVDEVSGKQKMDSEILRNIYALLKTEVADSEEMENTLGMLTLEEAKDFFYRLTPERSSAEESYSTDMEKLAQAIFNKLDDTKAKESQDINYSEIREIVSNEIISFRNYLKPYLETEDPETDSFFSPEGEVGGAGISIESLAEIKSFITETISSEVGKINRKIDNILQEEVGEEPHAGTHTEDGLWELKNKVDGIEEKVGMILSLLQREVEESQKIRDTYLSGKNKSPATSAKNDKKKKQGSEKAVRENDEYTSTGPSMEVDDDL